MSNGWFAASFLDQMRCREKRRQALLGSYLPRDILVSDAPMACQVLAEATRQGPFAFSAHWTSQPCLRKSTTIPDRIHFHNTNPQCSRYTGFLATSIFPSGVAASSEAPSARALELSARFVICGEQFGGGDHPRVADNSDRVVVDYADDRFTARKSLG